MAYNYYPATYQPVYPQNTGLIWIQGEAAAKSYLVAPNTTVALWDSESMTVYLKSADASGMPSMKILDYTIRGNTPPAVGGLSPEGKDIPDAVQAEIDGLRSEIEAIKNKMDELRKEYDK